MRQIMDSVFEKTYVCKTAFSAVMRSCSWRRSLLAPNAGNVELCASFAAADLNIVGNSCHQICSGRGRWLRVDCRGRCRMQQLRIVSFPSVGLLRVGNLHCFGVRHIVVGN